MTALPITARTLRLIARMRAAVDRITDDLTRALTASWVLTWNDLAPLFLTAVQDLIAASDNGRWPARGTVLRAQRTLHALEQTGNALERLAAQVRRDVPAAAREAATLGMQGQADIISSQLPYGATLPAAARHRAHQADAVDAIVRRTAEQVTARTWRLEAEATEAMKRELVRGVVIGDNPRDAADAMVRRVEGQFNGGLSRAMVIARTEVLDAHRQAAEIGQRDHADVLDGWIWHAEVTGPSRTRTCFPAGTRIRTRRGDIPIEEVSVGDVVLTHTGKWRRVYDTMSRPYSGPMVTVQAGPLSVTATADHPFLVERQGQLRWIEARHIRRGDYVLSDRLPDGLDHGLGEISVERGRDKPNHSEAAGLEKPGLLGVTVHRLRMPIGLVHLEGDSRLGEDKVHRTEPARDSSLLLEADAQGLEGEPDVALGDGFAPVTPVTADGAEPASVRGNDPDSLSAGGTFNLDGRASAFLGAVGVSRPVDAEQSAATGAGAIGDWLPGRLGNGWLPDLLVEAGKGTVFAPAAGPGSELRPALRACESFSQPFTAARQGAEPAIAGDEGFELLPAVLAGFCESRLDGLPCLAVRVLDLVGGVAGHPAELSLAFPDAGRGNTEDSSAALTSPFHRYIVSNCVTQIQAIRVFNIEVESDHSYVAEGIAVHNCPSCWAMHGTLHPMSEPGPLDHHQGRCSRTPKTKSWADLGFDVPEPPDELPDARAIFNGLPREEQLQIMGPARLRLLDDGAIEWADLSTRRSTEGWRDSFHATPIADLTKDS